MNKLKAAITTFGCQMNEYDSLRIIERLVTYFPRLAKLLSPIFARLN